MTKISTVSTLIALTLTVTGGNNELRVRVKADASPTSEAVSIAATDEQGRIYWKSGSTDGRAIDTTIVFTLPPGLYNVEGQEHHCCDERGKTFTYVVFAGSWRVR